MDRKQERRDHSPGTKQRPKERRWVLGHLVSQEDPRDNAGKNRAPDVVRTGDSPPRHPLFSDPDHGDGRGEVEPSNGMIKYGHERHAVKYDERWRVQTFDEPRIPFRSLPQGPDLQD